jgi:hypothetical protein
MVRIMRRVGLAAAVATLAVGVAVPAAAEAASQSVKVVQTGKPKGTRLVGKLSGSFGPGAGDGRLINPDATYIWKFKKGTIYAHGTGTGQKGTTVTGTWTIDRGTGAYKGIKGGGKYSGSLATFVFTFTGKASW